MLDKLARLPNYNEPAFRLLHLVNIDGAGDWPPRCNHSSWPAALLPYRDIYLELNLLLPAAEVSLDDEANQARRANYRALMRKLLAERVNMAEVESIMAVAEAGNWDHFPLDAYNGFYCAVAVCRHAYRYVKTDSPQSLPHMQSYFADHYNLGMLVCSCRWAMIPVVKAAQREKTVELPPELELPWPYLQRHFGCGAEAGNNTSNVVHNFDENGGRVYKINVGMPRLIQSSEDTFFRMFYDLEVLVSTW